MGRLLAPANQRPEVGWRPSCRASSLSLARRPPTRRYSSRLPVLPRSRHAPSPHRRPRVLAHPPCPPAGSRPGFPHESVARPRASSLLRALTVCSLNSPLLPPPLLLRRPPGARQNAAVAIKDAQASGINTYVPGGRASLVSPCALSDLARRRSPFARFSPPAPCHRRETTSPAAGRAGPPSRLETEGQDETTPWRGGCPVGRV